MADCTHPHSLQTSGPAIPRVYGSGSTYRCTGCGAWRPAWNPAAPWRPADTLAGAMEPDESR